MLRGVRRARAAMEKAEKRGQEANTAVGAAMVKRIVGPMRLLLAADLEARAAGKATRGGTLLRVLKDLDPETVCLAATRAALNRMSRTNKLAAVARRIGEALEDELRWHRWEKINKRQAEAVRKRVNQSKSPQQRRKALAGFAQQWERKALAEAWTARRIIGIGIRFVDYLVQLGVFEMTKIASRVPGKKQKAAHGVQLTVQAAEWAKEMGDFLAVSRPLSWPLVIPPVPWTSLHGGGFHFRDGIYHPSAPKPLRPLPLVRRASKEQRALLEKADLSTVYAGLNAVQATAWRINPRVYAVFTQLIEQEYGPGITAFRPSDIPGRLSDEEVKDEKKFRAHKNAIREAKTANAKMISKRYAQARVYSTAKKFVTYPELYFAYNLDFRGRVYACSDDLSPQGNDIQRGLLEFAHGDPLDAAGLRWLKIHLANTFGIDKVGFDARERWAEENEAMILAVATDPIDCREWHKADKKKTWQFLAACFAYADYKEHGLGVECRVPVMLDGSCSGIQHYAALLHDEVAGAAVNLVPGDKPGDLYNDVSERTKEILKALPPERMEGKGKDKRLVRTYAAEWLAFGIDRKITKRSVMVLPYGGSFLSNLDYVRDAVRERMESQGRPEWLTEENEKDAFVALAKIIWQAMREVVKGPVLGMNYVRSLAELWAKEKPDHKLHWTAPCGFPVVPDYISSRVEGGRIAGEVQGNPLWVGTHTYSDVTDWSAAAQAAAPNFVHSLDASHLLFSLKRAAEEGIDRLVTVHDAFGTTPTRTAKFAQMLREEFAKLYLSDPFDCLKQALLKLGVVPPESPSKGALRIEAIRKSDYLFA